VQKVDVWQHSSPLGLPTCQVFGLESGVIEDIALATDGTLKGLALNSSGLDAYDIDGKKIDPSLPVVPTTATKPGELSGCTGCLGMLQEGGAITGFLMVKGQVTAIIGQFSGPPGAGQARAPAAAEPEAEKPLPQPTSPYLQLFGTLPVTGQASAASGDTVEVFGSGFCAACSIEIRSEPEIPAIEAA
jgi:hypothetical protein